MSQSSRNTSLSFSSGNLHRRDSFDRTDRRESVAFDPHFLQCLRCLPDELEQLKRDMKSPSRFDKSSERSDQWWKEQLQDQEQKLKSEYDKRHNELKNHYEEQLRDSKEALKRDNNDLQKRLGNCETLLSRKEEKMKTLERRLEEAQERASLNANQVTGTERQRDNYPQEFWELKQLLEEKEKELQRLKERHAAISERRARSDQRKTEDTLSSNRFSELETEYVTDLKDGARVDAVEVITNSMCRWGEKPSPTDYLKYCRLACFIFETAYECVSTVKKAFINTSSATLQSLAMDAPSIGLEKSPRYTKFWPGTYSYAAEASTEFQDALSEVMILVKEQAKRHDVTQLVQEVKRAFNTKWMQQNGFLPRYDRMVLFDLDKYITYCTKFAWCMVCQVPPLKIEHNNTVYSSKSHSLSPAFSSLEDCNSYHCPIYPETQQSVMFYLWPTLQDSDGRVLVKGEVVLKDN